MDIVKRLREAGYVDINTLYKMIDEAADEIERLRGVLKVICQMPIDSDYSFEMTTIARAALKESE